ncbi:hypothetical protein [Xylella fastidiosa]|uniref:hypothetical protein n=1 Tax=Xylella fastidiosa TaxID=2371 RepID=UPI000045975B
MPLPIAAPLTLATALILLLATTPTTAAPSPEQHAAALVAQMTRQEKIAQTMNAAPAIPRLGIPAYDWWSEGLHGIARNGYATVFPQAIGLAASWNTDLLQHSAPSLPPKPAPNSTSPAAPAKTTPAMQDSPSGPLTSTFSVTHVGAAAWKPTVKTPTSPANLQ